MSSERKKGIVMQHNDPEFRRWKARDIDKKKINSLVSLKRHISSGSGESKHDGV